MNINEVAELIQLNRDEVKIAILNGLELPKSKHRIKIKADIVGDNYEIDEKSLDEFISKFHDEEPGHHPPIVIRRTLLVESRYRCAVCEEVTPIDFHHIIEFSRIKHYDPQQMLALCPTCHRMCGLGQIDQKAQWEIKRRLTNSHKTGSDQGFNNLIGPRNFSWDELREVIKVLHTALIEGNVSGDSKFDLSNVNLESKNRINRLSENYYQSVMIEHHEPYFNRIQNFLREPINQEITNLYHEIVDELRSKIAANASEFANFETFIVSFAEAAVTPQNEIHRISRRTLNILLSFMYINCDIGRKK